ncbi:MAG TPA: UDP-glucose 4-epimerase GalE [Azospirillaceae bacterium]|nr:UDP-glucose 4-epimerase GalE [Azospirillaceae bacterium]
MTGGAGYIGSYAVLALRDAGHRVVVLDDLSTGDAAAVPDDVRLVRGCVGDGELVGEVLEGFRIDAVLHLAARTLVPESMRDPVRYYLNNTANSLLLLDACLRAGVRRVVFSSTSAIYGEVGADPVTEEAVPAPVSPYGASKLMVERALADIGRATGLAYVALRYFNVAGADPAGRIGQRTAGPHLVKAACEAALGRRPHLDVFGRDYPTPDGTCVRDFIHVGDLVDAHLLALDHLFAGGGSLVLNCGYGRGYSVLDVVRAVERVTGARLPVLDAPRRPGDAAIVVADPSRLRAEFGWRPRLDDLDAIVASTLAWEARRAVVPAAP